VLNPAIVPLTYDSTLEARNSSDPFISLPNPGRHFRGDNMSLVDGHVKWKDMAGIQELQEQMKAWTFTNGDHSRVVPVGRDYKHAK
jgi:hypothetical protein